MSDARPHVHIHELEVFGRVGVGEQERQTPQRLVLNITVWPATAFASLSDDIERAVNYAAIAAEIQNVIATRCDKLIETLAEQLADQLLQRFAIDKAAVEVRKFVLSNAQYVSVTAMRNRADNA